MPKKRVTVLLDRDAHAALKAYSAIEGRTLGQAIDAAAWIYVDQVERDIDFAQRTGSGVQRSVSAIRKVSESEKIPHAEKDHSALKGTGLPD